MSIQEKNDGASQRPEYEFELDHLAFCLMQEAKIKTGLWRLGTKFSLRAATIDAPEEPGGGMPAAIGAVAAMALFATKKKGTLVFEAEELAEKFGAKKARAARKVMPKPSIKS